MKQNYRNAFEEAKGITSVKILEDVERDPVYIWLEIEGFNVSTSTE